MLRVCCVQATLHVTSVAKTPSHRGLPAFPVALGFKSLRRCTTVPSTRPLALHPGSSHPWGKMCLAAQSWAKQGLQPSSSSKSSGWRVREPASFLPQFLPTFFFPKRSSKPQRSLGVPRCPKLGHPAVGLPPSHRSLSASLVATIQPADSPEHVPTPVPRQ